ncbi:MAG: class II fructose-bisphosphate aldolase [Candidatus Sungbacteria bacterium]|nr:class II fructose-bisphosphate aldolase [Candidatus Sungbacteria bacterium]
MNLKEILSRAAKEHWATGHFNASELDQMRAIVEACKEVGAPAIIGTSEGEAKHLGYAEAVALRDVLRKEYGIQIFLNADHHKSMESAKAAIDAGYDSVHIDLSAKSFEENVHGTKEIVEYAHLQPTTYNLQPSIEGELGYLRGESQIQNEKIEVKPEDYTDPTRAKEFVEKTGVDRLAIAVGNIHGISLDEPTLDIERIKAIREVVPEEVTLVLHAGSGISDEQICAAIKAGIANIHINTELRAAFVNALKQSLKDEVDELAMYKLDRSAIQAMKELVKGKLKLFGSINKI